MFSGAYNLKKIQKLFWDSFFLKKNIKLFIYHGVSMFVYHSMYVEVRTVELVFFLQLYMGPGIEVISPGLGGQLSRGQSMLMSQG